MSVDMMTLVFKRYPVGGGEMLLALSLADHAHNDGTHIWPAIKTLAEKTRQSERNVQYQLRKMVLIGWLIPIFEGRGRGNTSEYKINPDWIAGADLDLSAAKKVQTATVEKVQVEAEKVQVETLKGAIAIAPESSVTIKEPSDARAIQRKTISEKPKPQGIVWDSGGKMFRGITDEQMGTWQEAFPKLDLDGELTRIELWYLNNPKKRKRHLQRFITNWLARAFKDANTPRVFVKRPPQPGHPP